MGKSEFSLKNYNWKEAIFGLFLALLPFTIVIFLIVIPAIDSLLFSLGKVPANNAAFSTGMHIISSKHLTLQVYKNLFKSKYFLQDLFLTITVTVISVIFILILSYILALYVRFSHGVFPRIVRTLYLIPMFIPVVITSYALITLWADHGLMDALLYHLGLKYKSPIYQASGIILGQVWQGIPFAVLLLSSGLDSLAEEQIEAARDTGANFFIIFLTQLRQK